MAEVRGRDVVRASLEAMLERERDLLGDLRGARVLLTGATGFVGKWLLESFTHANERLGLRARLVALSRDPEAFALREPRLHAAVDWCRGDVRAFDAPAGAFTHSIHAATDVARRASPEETLGTIVDGTREILRHCTERGVGRLLYVSSGAVYGRQPPSLARIDEGAGGEPLATGPGAAYGQGKRAAESLVVAHSRDSGLHACIARCFAIVGPYLPLDGQLAVGAFIADRLAGRAVQVRGDGTAVRSYLYAGDLAHWLWTILLRGAAGTAYNVGSEEAVTMADLARRVAAMENGAAGVQVTGAVERGLAAERYVPSTRKARTELGLEPTVGLDEALALTLAWARQGG